MGGDGRSWWMSTLLFWQSNLLQSWQSVMEAQEIPGAVAFSIPEGRATSQTELDEPFIVWPALGWVTSEGPRCLQKPPRTKRRGEKKEKALSWPEELALLRCAIHVQSWLH